MQDGASPAARASDAGAETFARYRWQAKMALLAWLPCVDEADKDAPLLVICEHLEDVVVCHASHSVFAQLKTRDRGSWSDSAVCAEGGGMDSLCRTHSAILALKVSHEIRYELWLEGPAAATKATAAFFADPTSAPQPTITKLSRFGLKAAQVPQFLQSVSIRPNRPPRSMIDARLLQAIGVMWPSLTFPEQRALCQRLLHEVELAQSADEASTASSIDQEAGVALRGIGVSDPDAIASRCLTRARLLALVPPLPAESRADVVARLAQTGASALELKLRRAGASEQVRTAALQMRAEAETRRQEILTLDNGEQILAGLESELLLMAESSARAAQMAGGGNVAAAARPADFVFDDLLRRPAELRALDRSGIFGDNTRLIMGYLGHLSDSCRFWWRAD